MLTTRLLTTVALAFASFALWAQELMEPKIWHNLRYDWNEHLYYDGTLFRADYEAFQPKKNEVSRQQKWMVFTVAEGIPVYGAPNGQISGVKLPFGQELWVIEENDKLKKEIFRLREKERHSNGTVDENNDVKESHTAATD